MRRDSQDDGREPQHLQQGRKGNQSRDTDTLCHGRWCCMMGKRHCILVLLLALALSLSACSQTVPESTDRIISPVNMTVPAAGTWVLERRLADDITAVSDAADGLTGEKVGFTRDTMLYAGQVFTGISYKIKRVKVHEYFLHRNWDILNNLDYGNNEILVVNVYSKDSFLFEFIIDSNGEKI